MNEDRKGRLLCSGFLSARASFSIEVVGHIGARELRRLIEKLELDRQALAQDEAQAQSDLERMAVG